MSNQHTLETKIIQKEAKVAIIGLGYVGLPLALEFLNSGFSVIGIDVSSKKIESLKKCKSDVSDISDDQIKKAIDSKKFIVTESYESLVDADIINICVPTPLNKTKDPDVSYILDAVNGIKKYLHAPQLIVLESTTYPGTTEELILPILQETGLVAGEDFFLAFSPERVDPGNKKFNIHNTPKIVGGITPVCTDMAYNLYAQVIQQVIKVSSSRAAEMVKLLENTYRSVNIGLVNEIALMCDRLKIDVWEVIDSAATKPFGFMPFYPGPGLGGHCIPIDPFYLSWKLKTLNYYARFIELSGDINSNMPAYVVSKVTDMLNQHKKCVNGAKIFIIGIAYKENINDVRESPALDIIKLLQEKGADVLYNDPYVESVKLNGEVIKSSNLTKEQLNQSDCVIITTAHSMYDLTFIVENANLIFDTRNALKNVKSRRDKIYKL